MQGKSKSLAMEKRNTAKPVWRPIAVSIGIAVVVAYALHGGAIHFMIAGGAACLAVVVGASASVALAVMFAFSMHFESEQRVLRLLVVRSGAVLATALLSIMLGVPLAWKYIADAKHWYEAQVPAIDAYKVAHGEYPPSLAEVSDITDAPKFVRSSQRAYERSDGGFSFYITDGNLYPLRWGSWSRSWGVD